MIATVDRLFGAAIISVSGQDGAAVAIANLRIPPLGTGPLATLCDPGTQAGTTQVVQVVRTRVGHPSTLMLLT